MKKDLKMILDLTQLEASFVSMDMTLYIRTSIYVQACFPDEMTTD